MTLTDQRQRHVLIAIVLCGAMLRLTGLNWDEGRGLHPDEGNLVRAALALSFPDRMIPEFHAYNDLALWLPRLMAWPLCANGDGACLTLAARLVSALLSIATIPVAAMLARGLAGPVAGIAAAFAFATSGPLVQWAHFGTTESALAFLVIALWAAAAMRLDGRIGDRRFALWTGVLLGLGFGFKTTALVLAVIPMLTLALLGVPNVARLRAVGQGVALAIALALITTSSIWAATDAWLDVMRFENGVVTGAVQVFWTEQFKGARHGSYELGQLWRALSGAGVLLALAGLVLLPTAQRRSVLPGLVFAVVYAAITFGWHAKFFRYLSPLIPVFLILGAVAVGRLTSYPKSRTAAALALSALSVMGLAGLDQAAVYLKTDPRLLAETALRRLAHPEDLVAIEPHDTGQIGGLTAVVLPLTAPGAGDDGLVKALASADWVLIASRRNWSVLPRSSAEACGFYANLAQGDLGFTIAGRFGRTGPLGRIFAPGIGAEETRVVFDRPEVLLLRNTGRQSPDEIAARLAAPVDQAVCAPAALAAALERAQ